ncbi:ABC transporter G family member 20-like isoform X2 [Dysidea avara]|uniref:ABC transporter G family member 20-like isoform X2 n=1 Tax=Dysidea avara TaxID=196820 RepID=UPI003317805B
MLASRFNHQHLVRQFPHLFIHCSYAPHVSYGLLGASGCGKTTLLRCVLGRLPIQSGQILILGQPPGTRGHSVPGKGVGYMPQEEAIAYDFKMRELLYYFGVFYQMKLQHIKERTELLKEFLDLPTANVLCSTLSGGQRRRVSLAVALLHEPPLLILDEPTVGLDPLLRAKIWEHLLEITSTGNTTIIITTHYIEEARQANMVGLMRAGKLLAQSPPERLITTYGVTSLEDVFLKILEQQDSQVDKTTSTETSKIQQDDQECTPLKYPSYFSGIHFDVPQRPKLSNVVALSCKELMKFVRSLFLLFHIVIHSTIQLSILCLAYGQDVKDIKIYHSNFDTAYHSDFFNGTFDLGRSFLSHIDYDTIDLETTFDIAEGRDKVQDGSAWGYFSIPKNYSQNYIERLVTVCEGVEDGSPVYPDEVSGAAIELILDLTDPIIISALNNSLSQAAKGMRREFLRNTSIPEFYFNPLIQINNIVYGGGDLRYTEYFAPALIIGGTMYVGMTLTVTNLITIRKSGLYDRTWVAGVSVIEVVMSQVIGNSFVMLLQMIPAVFFIIYVFNITMEGNIGLVILLAYFEGICGLALGLLISVFLYDEAAALQVSVTLFYPLLLIAGVFWPIESFEKWIQTITYLFPITYPAEGARSILLRGWGITDEPVYLGMVVLVVWIILLLLMTCLGLQIRKY